MTKLIYFCNRPTPQGDCSSAKCRITFCHTCYYDDEYHPLPGDCDTCPYYPEAVNGCFKRWGICIRRANAAQYPKVFYFNILQRMYHLLILYRLMARRKLQSGSNVMNILAIRVLLVSSETDNNISGVDSQ